MEGREEGGCDNERRGEGLLRDNKPTGAEYAIPHNAGDGFHGFSDGTIGAHCHLAVHGASYGQGKGMLSLAKAKHITGRR
jgi:hypothetical protein